MNRADGEKVAWFDRRTGYLKLLVEDQRDAVLDALAPYLVASPVPAAHKELRSEDDLAGNRPGDALQMKVDELTPGFWRWALARLSGRSLEVDSWRTGLAGERRVGAELERLVRQGWRVLHSIPLASDVDIDHLLIGPGGAFCFNTKCHRGARVWVGDDSVRIGGQSYPYVRKSRAESRRASAALTRACGFAVEVQPVLAFVAVAELIVVPTLRDVRVLREQDITVFKHLKAEWASGKAELVYQAARSRQTWTRS
ncbi:MULTISPECIES: nuclease-related domain-containing protein [unclassified Streptomyces]|uniref:nuclease-related domain-containing protein n=1 Tax=unclassified Streptomyces TaxID=2593676 RepID=UPI0023672D39|nr:MULTISPECIES: nuclease-related domain-containing protein [unclassified Streptomyces]MDF3140854.1 nuclease-related domain-containing protein [Streptomyces sp. T21Q-yed]WDF40367.1 nuclease-related domain-containing protein [Streptomyces sp. T12]